jgi:hypothetical protein
LKNLVLVSSALVALAVGSASCSNSTAKDEGGSGGTVSNGGRAGSSGAGGVTGGGPDGAVDAAGSEADAAVGPDGGMATVRIVRGDPNETTWFTFAIEGRGLASDEGRVVTARIGMPDRPPERLGTGQVRVENGAFRIEFPRGCEGFLYKQKVLFIDVDADGVCTPGVDRVYSDFRFLESDLTVTLADSVPTPPGNVALRFASDSPAAPSCQVLNQAWPDS